MAQAKSLFPLGQCEATHAAIGALEDNETFPIVYLKRHATGDFGDVTAIEMKTNYLAIERGLTIASRYRLADGQTIQIVTQPDRTKTTITLTSEWRKQNAWSPL